MRSLSLFGSVTHRLLCVSLWETGRLRSNAFIHASRGHCARHESRSSQDRRGKPIAKFVLAPVKQCIVSNMREHGTLVAHKVQGRVG